MAPSSIRRLESLTGVPMALVRQLNRIDEARGREALYRVQRRAQLETLTKVARIQSAEASNAIEGIHAPSARIRQLVEKKSEPRNRSEAEIAGYRSALDLIHSSNEDIPFTLNVVLQLHKMMMEFTGIPGGSFKSTDNVIEEKHPDGTRTVRFTPTPSWQTPDAMRLLHEEFHQAIARDEQSPILLLAAYILDFTCIHPFNDGNGRMSRLLTLLGMYRFHYSVGRYVSLEKVIAEQTEGYYESLGASSQGWQDEEHDLMPWFSFFVGSIVAAYERFETNVGAMSERRGAKGEAVETFIRTRAVPVFRFADIREAVPTASDGTIRAILYRLRDDGVVESVGRGRGAKWRRLDE